MKEGDIMFKEELSLVPHLPGCYLMRNKDNIVIYVGNAKALSIMGILSGDEGMAMRYGMRADTLKSLVENDLWNTRHQFFETMRTDSSANTNPLGIEDEATDNAI